MPKPINLFACASHGLLFGLAVLTPGTTAAQEPSVPPSDCASLFEKAKTVGQEAAGEIAAAKAHADEDTQAEKSAVDACATGYITMEKNHVALDIPEFKMTNQKISLDIPQITMKDKKIIFDTPSVKCTVEKVGQYPETTCEDTWIHGPFGFKTKGVPKCTVYWSDIKTTVCKPFMERQEIVMGVPETKIDKAEMIVGIPEMTMKRQDWYFDLPKFNVTSGCFGSGCEKKCDEASKVLTDKYQSLIGPSIKNAKETVTTATHNSMMCQRGVTVAQRDATLANIDSNIAIVRSSVAQLQALGASDEVAKVQEILNTLIETRAKVSEQFDKQILSIDESELKQAS